MLSHSFDRFYVVTKFILPTLDDHKFSPFDFDSECNYLNVDLDRHRYAIYYLPNIKNICMKIVPFVHFYKKQIDSHNKTVHGILMKEIPLILSKFSKEQKGKERYNDFIINSFYWIGK